MEKDAIKKTLEINEGGAPENEAPEDDNEPKKPEGDGETPAPEAEADEKDGGDEGKGEETEEDDDAGDPEALEKEGEGEEGDGSSEGEGENELKELVKNQAETINALTDRIAKLENKPSPKGMVNTPAAESSPQKVKGVSYPEPLRKGATKNK